MSQSKLRVIKPSQPTRGLNEIYGVTIPKKIAVFYKDTYFTVNKTHEGILLISGTHFKQIKEDVDLEQYKV